ncbi:MAG: hypothetical protein K2L24_00570 [Opitutales bacterium]|nr:hypothetical protein [Opitutales bacterium]
MDAMGIFKKLLTITAVSGLTCAFATPEKAPTIESIARAVDPDWESTDELIMFEAHEKPHEHDAAKDPYIKRSLALLNGKAFIKLVAFAELPYGAKILTSEYLGLSKAKSETIVETLEQTFSDEIFAIQVVYSLTPGGDSGSAFRGLLFVDQAENGGLSIHFWESPSNLPTLSENDNRALQFQYTYSTLRWVQEVYGHPIHEIFLGYPGMTTEPLSMIPNLPSWKEQNGIQVVNAFNVCFFASENVDELSHEFPQAAELLAGKDDGIVVFSDQKPFAIVDTYTRGHMAIKFVTPASSETASQTLEFVTHALGDALSF